MGIDNDKDFTAIVDHYDKLDGTEYENNDTDDTESDADDDSGADSSENVDTRRNVEDGDGDGDPPVRAKAKSKQRGDEEGTRTPLEKVGDTDPKAGIRPIANGVFADAQGNIVDPRDGTILARAGSERRLFERASRMNVALQQQAEQMKNLQAQLQGAQVLNGVPQKYGLTNDETAEGLGYIVAFKRDPLGTVRKLVERVAAMGHNVSDILGKEAGDAVEMNAIQRMLDERLAPILNERRQQQDREQAMQKAQRGLQQFIADHENADTHITVIDRMMGSNPRLTPERAYMELKMFAIRNRLDFSKPLLPQMQALQQQQGDDDEDEGDHRQPTRQRVVPGIPNGRGTGGTRRAVSDTDMADPRSSWSDIINSVLRN